ncbi:MAG: hypothetical protein ACE148_00355 [Vicinamibacterales bacterium]
MKPVVFYVSGHGFGHASRDIEVINALHALRPSLPVVVRTSARRWLFDLTVRNPIEFHEVVCDTGVVQVDSLHLDEQASIRDAGLFYGDLDRRSEGESAFLQSIGAGLVVGDIPPLAFTAAARAGVRSIALGNFTWDWIYEEYAELLPRYHALLPTVRDSYRHAELALRLPLCGGFESFGRVVDIPFVARHRTRERAEVRQSLGLAPDRPTVLLSFGGYGLGGLQPAGIEEATAHGYTVVTTDQAGAREVEGSASRQLVMLTETSLYARGYRYEDLLAAVDVVMTKPGYGIIAECIANGTAMVYTSRGRFREYGVLVEGIQRYLRHSYISNEDLYEGCWSPFLDQALAMPPPATTPPTNGAERAAEMILALL